jgi:DNA ligase-1
MRFIDVVNASNDVAAASGRLAKISRFAELLRMPSANEIPAVVSMLSGTLRQGRTGIGYDAIVAASTAAPADAPMLTVDEVDAAFDTLASLGGTGVARTRAGHLTSLFARATHEEQDFLRRLLTGGLRQGALEGVVLEAVAKSANVSPARLRRAVLMSGSLAAAAVAALTDHDRGLDAIAARVMQPVRPMLADSAAGVDEALGALEDAALEFKLDGARIQLHKSGDEVRLFSRTLRDVTASAPEIVALGRKLPARELILDGEVIALAEDGTPRPFQTTMRRFGRTKDVETLRRELPLTLFAFDSLFLDGMSLLDEPLERRTAVLRDVAPAVAVPLVSRPTVEEARAFVAEAARRGHEGVMAKSLSSPYAAGRRGSAWLKIKQARALDLVVLAAEWGHGRRHGRLSNLHLGARDPIGGGFIMLGKTFKGMTDEMLTWQTDTLLSLEVARDGIIVFVKPELVVEVAFNEIQESRVYAGGLTLRFARVKRYRTDKTAADANTIDDVRRLAGL